MKFITLTLFLVLHIASLIAQTTEEGLPFLSLEEAIEIGLVNNYSIRIAKVNEEIATTNNNAGNAGFLPRVTANGSLNYTSSNTRQQFFSGDERSGVGAGNTQARAGIGLTWTAFDGFRMFAARDRLQLSEDRSKTFTKSEMQDLVTAIQSAYYGLARIKQQIGIVEQSIQLNKSLLELAEAKLKIGTGTSLDVLQTSNNLNADSSALLNLKDQFQQSAIGMNRLIGRSPDIQYEVTADLPSVILPSYDELQNAAIQNNYALSLLGYDEKIALAQIREVRSGLFPTVDLNAGMNYNYSKAEVGFLLSNRSYGPTVGVSFNYDLFPGRNIKKDIQVAEKVKENILLQKADLSLQVSSELMQLYKQYLALERLKELEKGNILTAEKNVALASELYRSGRATSLDVREAILGETRVRDRLSDVEFRQKLTEINIKNLTGMVFM